MATIIEICTLLLVLSLSCQNVYSFMDMDELKSVYYGLDILSEPVVITEEVPVGAVHVTSKYGQQYQCTFPDHSTEEKRKEEEEKIAVETGIIEMLKPMGLGDCLFKSKDWWSYEFCYGKYIRQFHMEDGDIKGNIMYLGYYHDDFDWNNETAREERLKSKATLQRYHSQTYTLGTKCDLTGEMRRAEVRFMCEENSEDYLSRVDESETCVYTVTVMTSRICRHPYLKAPAKRKPVPITCNPLLSEDQYHDYMVEIEERKRKQEKLHAEAKSALDKEDSSKLEWQKELDIIDDTLSVAAKELLTKPMSELFPDLSREMLTKEDFQKMFGNDDTIWQMYQKGIEAGQKYHIGHLKKLHKIQEMMKEQAGKSEEEEEEGEEKEEEGGKREEKADEDDELLSEFDEEISTIKAKFQTSKSKLSKVQQKLAVDKLWESEIENAIREAEEELGVKVDRTLISGLSNTLDKLVNKLHDTERELSSMDKKLGKLKPGQKDGKEDDEAEEDDDDEEDEKKRTTVTDESSHVKEWEDDGIVEEEDVEYPQGKPNVGGQYKDGGIQPSGGGVNDLHDKIQAPPVSVAEKTQAPSSMHTRHGDEFLDEEDAEIDPSEVDDVAKDDASAADAGAAAAEGDEGKPELEITLKKINDDDADLPKDVQKLLEESVRKEYEKHRLQSDSQPLTFDADHSFNREKTVHVIQQEDEDGKTNRFIFVFGFNTFNDESAESERQSALEENYSYVYKGKKNKKLDSPES